MSGPKRLTIDQIVPGGIRQDDHVHSITNDNTCSRCREAVPEDDVPLLLWTSAGTDMLIYCEKCLGAERGHEHKN